MCALKMKNQIQSTHRFTADGASKFTGTQANNRPPKQFRCEKLMQNFEHLRETKDLSAIARRQTEPPFRFHGHGGSLRGAPPSAREANPSYPEVNSSRLSRIVFSEQSPCESASAPAGRTGSAPCSVLHRNTASHAHRLSSLSSLSSHKIATNNLSLCVPAAW